MIDNHSENENGCQVYQLTIGNPRYNISWKIVISIMQAALFWPYQQFSIAFFAFMKIQWWSLILVSCFAQQANHLAETLSLNK